LNLVRVKDKNFIPLIEEKALLERIGVLGAELTKDYRGKSPLFIVVLNGAFLFAAELFKRIDLECEISFIRLSSYAGTSSTGKVAFMMQLSETVRNRDVVIIEDIVDTGRTLAAFLPHLQLEKPTSIRIASMLSKPSALKENVKIDYLGFEIEDKFVVGFGLDYDGAGRNLPGIFQLAG
jgi:hypoxanthine phosphoribosyltransferase